MSLSRPQLGIWENQETVSIDSEKFYLMILLALVDRGSLEWSPIVQILRKFQPLLKNWKIASQGFEPRYYLKGIRFWSREHLLSKFQLGFQDVDIVSKVQNMNKGSLCLNLTAWGQYHKSLRICD